MSDLKLRDKFLLGVLGTALLVCIAFGGYIGVTGDAPQFSKDLMGDSQTAATATPMPTTTAIPTATKTATRAATARPASTPVPTATSVPVEDLPLIEVNSLNIACKDGNVHYDFDLNVASNTTYYFVTENNGLEKLTYVNHSPLVSMQAEIGTEGYLVAQNDGIETGILYVTFEEPLGKSCDSDGEIISLDYVDIEVTDYAVVYQYHSMTSIGEGLTKGHNSYFLESSTEVALVKCLDNMVVIRPYSLNWFWKVYAYQTNVTEENCAAVESNTLAVRKTIQLEEYKPYSERVVYSAPNLIEGSGFLVETFEEIQMTSHPYFLPVEEVVAVPAGTSISLNGGCYFEEVESGFDVYLGADQWFHDWHGWLEFHVVSEELPFGDCSDDIEDIYHSLTE